MRSKLARCIALLGALCLLGALAATTALASEPEFVPSGGHKFPVTFLISSGRVNFVGHGMDVGCESVGGIGVLTDGKTVGEASVSLYKCEDPGAPFVCQKEIRSQLLHGKIGETESGKAGISLEAEIEPGKTWPIFAKFTCTGQSEIKLRGSLNGLITTVKEAGSEFNVDYNEEVSRVLGAWPEMQWNYGGSYSRWVLNAATALYTSVPGEIS